MLVRRRGDLRGCSGWLALGLCGALGVASGCTSREPPPVWAQTLDGALDEALSPACAPVPAERPLPVITTLVTRDHEVTVYGSDEGLRFSVAQADGARVGRLLSAREFERSFPALHRRFDATFADGELWLDASLQGLRTPQASEHEAAAMDGLRTPQASEHEAAAMDGLRTPQASEHDAAAVERLREASHGHGPR